MKKTSFYIYFSILLLTLYSCEKDADIDLPVIEPKLVLVSLISPQDTSIQVRVSLSQPLYNNPDSWKHIPVANATVVISSGSGSITLPYNSQLERYSVSAKLFKINSADTYQLSVSTPEGKFAQASTRVPDFNPSFTASATADLTKTDTFFLHAIWKDPVGAKNYYRLDLQRYTMLANSYFYKNELIKDDESDGETIRRDWEFPYSPASQDSLVTTLYALTPELYEYLDRLNKVFTDGDPFSEPVPMYTNVEGGFGVFGGHNSKRVKVLP